MNKSTTMATGGNGKQREPAREKQPTPTTPKQKK